MQVPCSKGCMLHDVQDCEARQDMRAPSGKNYAQLQQQLRSTRGRGVCTCPGCMPIFFDIL